MVNECGIGSAHADSMVKSYNIDISNVDVSKIKDPTERAAFDKFKKMLNQKKQRN